MKNVQGKLFCTELITASFFLLSFFFLPIQSAHCQPTPLNKLDSAGKKDGYWIRYYNKQWKVVDDSSEAYYYYYTYFDHGNKTQTTAKWGTKGGKLEDSTAGNQRMGKIKLLDGKYTWYDNKGRVFAAFYFDKGEPVSWKQFYPSGKLYMHFDYTIKYDGKPHSYHIYVYDKNGNLLLDKPECKYLNGKWPVE